MSVSRNINYSQGAFPRMTTSERTALTPQNGFCVYDTTLNQPFQYIAGAWQAIYPQGSPILPVFIQVKDGGLLDTYSCAIDGTTMYFNCYSYSNLNVRTSTRPFAYVDGATKLSVFLMNTATENKNIYWAVTGGGVGEGRSAHTNGRGATTGALTISFTADVMLKQELANALNGFSSGDILNAQIYSTDAPTKVYVFGFIME